ncbi:hypothetical protein V2J09_013510 [Rumex salicifolius]
MGNLGFSPFMGSVLLFVLLLFQPCKASTQMINTIPRGFEGVEMTYVDNNGVFLLSNSSNFGFGFLPTKDVTLFLLVILHMDTNRQIWAANRGYPIQSSDKFGFDSNGVVSLQSGGKVIWSPDTGGKAVSSIQLLDSGNLVMLGDDNSTVWESFRHPTDTLVSKQVFSEGMNLSSTPDANNMSYFLQLKNGDLQLLVDFNIPQPYWAMSKDRRSVINSDGGPISQAVIDGNSWKFYDESKVFLLQFIFSSDESLNSTWIVVLGSDGSVSFESLQSGGTVAASPTKIPSDSCGTPGHCGAYYSCSSNTCQCSPGLLSRNCKTGIATPCDNGSKASTEMLYAGDDLSYFALDYVSPTSKTDLNRCKASCAGNCSCLAMFFSNETGSCYLFDNVGSFKADSSSNYAAYVKVSTINSTGGGGSSNNNHSTIVAVISVVTILVILSMLYGGYMYYKKKKQGKLKNVESPNEGSEEDIMESLSSMPVRYTFKDLETATNNFAVKLGQGGFGSVYQGVLPDGSRIAVKKLEGVGQGKKEFNAEVRIIGSIHHNNLVRLRGFCTEGKKSDVYSYGMVLLEIIGGRKNYDPQQSSEKSHFPSYAFKKMEEGKLIEVLDSSLKYNEEDESACRAIKVALWCIQEDMSMRPPMTKVVQMLEGLCDVPQPPTSSLTGARLFTSLFKSMSEGTATGTSSGPSDCNSDTYQSAVRLSGPR